MHGTLALFLYLLLEATHRKIRCGMVELERGQVSKGRYQLSEAVGLTPQQIRTCEKNLVLLGMIERKSTNKFCIYTIVNYSEYQDIDSTPNKQVTNNQQTTNKQVTTIQTHKHINTQEENHCAPNGDASTKLYSSSFETFYGMYPKKKSKGTAAKAFAKIKSVEYQAVKDGLLRAIDSDDWKKNNGEFIPHPASWLNARGWEDEHTKSTTKKAWE